MGQFLSTYNNYDTQLNIELLWNCPLLYKCGKVTFIYVDVNVGRSFCSIQKKRANNLTTPYGDIFKNRAIHKLSYQKSRYALLATIIIKY